MLWVWDLVAAAQVTEATSDLHVLDVTKTTCVLVVGAFLVHEQRTARAVAERDQLTGVLNRRGVAPLLEDLPVDAGLVLVDVDRFKQVNDQHGHHAGTAPG